MADFRRPVSRRDSLAKIAIQACPFSDVKFSTKNAPSTRGHRVDEVGRAARACYPFRSPLGPTARTQLNFPSHFRSESERGEWLWNVHFRRSIGIPTRRFRDAMRWPERPLWADGARRMAARRDCDRAARMEARHRCNCVAAYNQ